MDYLDRYQAGEHDAVWAELRAMGADLLHNGLFAEARDVAEAMMMRLRRNLIRIQAGLRTAGYEFVTVGPAVPDFGTVNAAVQASAAESLLGHPGLSEEQKEQLLASLPQLLGGLKGDTFARSERVRDVMVRPSALGDPLPFRREIGGYEKVVGPVPLALAAFWRSIGSVDFTGRMNGNGEARFAWHPLVILPPAGLLDDYIEWKYEGGAAPYRAELLPDPAGDDGPLILGDMSAGADVRLSSGEWLVDYLRRSTRAACLPGLEHDVPVGVRAAAQAWEPF